MKIQSLLASKLASKLVLKLVKALGVVFISFAAAAEPAASVGKPGGELTLLNNIPMPK